ncbi:MAG TPA: lipase maturation factor family protein, partial [Acidimicrobiales bacterium]|nr:lipase maturation factor family protein [Acidimicrobiales bacterium]
MSWFSAEDYWVARLVFGRLLGFTYLLAFVGTALQFKALLGERGLVPVPRFLRAVSFRRAPSIFHLHYSDRFAVGAAWTGAALAAAVVAGVAEQAPLGVCMLVWAAMWALYLSFVNVGQTFYGFGWETLLLEAGFLAIFLGNAETAPPLLVVLLIRWLLLRLELGAGLIKIRHDRCWRNLTCLDYHHETQPIPNPLSWYFHRLPKPLHRVEVAANHVVQLVASLALFAPQPIAAVAGGLVVVTQCWLFASGNYAWLNLITTALAVVSIPDSVLGRFVPVDAPVLHTPPSWFTVTVVLVTLAVAVLSYRPVRNLASRHQLMNASFDPLRLVNTYGVFGRITRERYEVVVEGTDEPVVGAATTWKEYEFKAKPGDTRRRPRQVAPYHLRLDWLMWFAALSPAYAEAWLIPLLARLLENDPTTLRLLAGNPFPDRPPNFVRARLYRYRF